MAEGPCVDPVCIWVCLLLICWSEDRTATSRAVIRVHRLHRCPAPLAPKPRPAGRLALWLSSRFICRRLAAAFLALHTTTAPQQTWRMSGTRGGSGGAVTWKEEHFGGFTWKRGMSYLGRWKWTDSLFAWMCDDIRQWCDSEGRWYLKCSKDKLQLVKLPQGAGG